MNFLSLRGENSSNGTFDWEAAIIDSAIMGALTFFTSLGGMAVVGIPTPTSLAAASIAAATEFFLTLAIKRKLREPEP